MHAFDDDLIEALKPELGGETIFHVGLGAHAFQIAFGSLRLQNLFRVDFCLRGAKYSWSGGPCPIPVWLLIGQAPNTATLEAPTGLKLSFVSGDWLRLHTDEGPYES